MSESYECKQMPLILYAPNNTIELKLIATVINEDGSTMQVMDKIPISRLYEARIEGEIWENENGTWVINDDKKE